jgi:hypothetical protein
MALTGSYFGPKTNRLEEAWKTEAHGYTDFRIADGAQREDPQVEEGVAWGLGSTSPFMSAPGLRSRCPSCRFAEAAGPP